MLTMLRFMRMSMAQINTKTMATTIQKGTDRDPRNTTTSTMTMGTIVGKMGERICGNSPSSCAKLIRRVDRYIC